MICGAGGSKSRLAKAAWSLLSPVSWAVLLCVYHEKRGCNMQQPCVKCLVSLGRACLGVYLQMLHLCVPSNPGKKFWFKNISFCVQTSGTRKITLSRCSWGVSSPEHICMPNAGKKWPMIVWGGMFFFTWTHEVGNKDLLVLLQC